MDTTGVEKRLRRIPYGFVVPSTNKQFHKAKLTHWSMENEAVWGGVYVWCIYYWKELLVSGRNWEDFFYAKSERGSEEDGAESGVIRPSCGRIWHDGSHWRPHYCLPKLATEQEQPSCTRRTSSSCSRTGTSCLGCPS